MPGRAKTMENRKASLAGASPAFPSELLYSTTTPVPIPFPGASPPSGPLSGWLIHNSYLVINSPEETGTSLTDLLESRIKGG